MADKMITINQLLEIIPVSRGLIQLWLRNDDYAYLKFPSCYHIGGRILWSFNEVQSWIETQKQPKPPVER